MAPASLRHDASGTGEGDPFKRLERQQKVRAKAAIGSIATAHVDHRRVGVTNVTADHPSLVADAHDLAAPKW
jgi:hypothetical protein